MKALVTSKEIGGITSYLTRRGVKMFTTRQFLKLISTHFEIHSMNYLNHLLCLLLMATGSIYDFYLHGDGYKSKQGWKRIIFRWILRTSKSINCVNEKIASDITAIYNVATVSFNPFLPPINTDINYPASLIGYIKYHAPILMVSTSKNIKINDIDLYGLDICEKLFVKLKEIFPDIGFIHATTDNVISDNLYVLSGYDITGLFRYIDLFIRPTYQDGYGISVDEAIYFDKPALASDCCKRHPRAIIFKNRDFNDLFIKTFKILTYKQTS